MRWPFRRKAAEQTATAPVERDSPQGSVALPVDEAAVTRAPARQWATLPAIPTVIPRTTPLVVGPAPVVPLLRLDDRHRAARVDVPTGTVTGLARPVVRAPEPVSPAQHADVAPPPIARRVARPVPTEVTPLVEAVDEYVGEPREPAEPYKAPGWLRFMPDWAKAGQQSPAIPGLPGPAPAEPELVVAEPPSFLPPELRNPQKELPPRMAEGVQPAETIVSPARRRRPSLGQTRRLGLGAPISKPDLVHPEEPPPIVDGTVHKTQEPPPPSAAPAHVAAEPVRESEPAPEPVPAEREPSRADTSSDVPTRPADGPSPAAIEASTSIPGRDVPKSAASTPDIGETSPSVTDFDRYSSDSGRSVSEAGRISSEAGQASDTSRTAPGGPGGSRPVVPAKPVPATYRATAELRPAPRRELPRATVVDRVPAALANEVRARQQADVTEVPVYRGPKVGEVARSRGARAFAAGGAVFLPDDAGPVDSPRARGLLAHELVHAVQQRTFGSRLPSHDSPLGQRLEAEAQAAERFYAGEAGAAEPPPLIHAPMPSSTLAEPDLMAAAQLATELMPAPASTQQTMHSPLDASTTAEVGRIATESARHVVQEWTNPRLQRAGGASGGQTDATDGASADGGTHGAGSHGAGGHGAGGHGAGSHGAGTPGAGGRSTGRSAGTHPGRGGATSSFNAAALREQLVAAALARHNATLEPGQAQVGELSQAELDVIDRQVEAEAAQHGVSAQSTQPPAQHYEPNSANAWMHAITGANMNYGSGMGGWREPVGSERSWYGSTTNDTRPLADRLADQFGIINADTDNSYDDWFQQSTSDSQANGQSGSQQGTAGNAAADPNHPAQHEDHVFGRPNPDRSAVDINKIDLDELATRLYDRIRSRIRLELLVDRERAGMLTDFR